MPTPITPRRKSRVLFDVPDSALVSPAWGIRRRGGEIAPKAAAGQVDDRLHSNMKLWSTGAWTLRPLQTEISDITEYEIGLTLIQIPDNQTLLEKLVTAETLFVENQYRYNDDLPGLPASTAALPSGGPFVVRKIPSGGSFDSAVPSGTPSLLSGKPAPPVTPLDRVGESSATYPENQAWFLSWNPSGHALAYPEYVFAFYFGQFGLALTGSGKAELYEYCLNTGISPGQPGGGPAGVPPEAYQWIKRKEWKYARTGQVSDTAHSMAIWPHNGPGGEKFLSFTNGQVDFAEVVSTAQHTGARATAPGDAVYKIDSTAPAFQARPPRVVTDAGPFRFDIRRDLDMRLQVSTLGFPLSGYLVDDPAALPDQNSGVPVNAYADTQTPEGTALAATLLDAETGNAYDPVQHTKIVARFDLSSDGSTTPILWGYSMNRLALIDINAPGAFTGGNLKSVNLAGYSGDPAQETGSLIIDDVRGELLALLSRGQLSVRVEVDHEENGQIITTPVFLGYVNRPEAVRKVKPGRTFPSANRHLLTLPLVGQWLRLAEAVSHSPQQFSFYDNVTNPGDVHYPDSVTGGEKIPWKATDAIVWLLGAAGMTPSQINIPDLPLRLWPGFGEKADEWVVDPRTDYAEMAQRIARNFLGQYLCLDLPTAAWTLLAGTPLDAPPCFQFYTESANQILGANVFPGNQGYPPGSTFITEFHVTTVPPEFNAVHVLCPAAQTSAQSQQVFECWLFNYNSFPVPGTGFRPDPANPDYLGRLREVEIVDPSLTGRTDAETQAAVNWTARRIFDFTCHAQRLAHFESPLPFILDPVTNLYRLPRFLDPIAINGQSWQVKCCAPHYTWDGKQMAAWEVIQPIAGQSLPPGIESLGFFRNAAARHAQKAAGHASQSARFGSLGIAAHGEDRYRNLPRNIAYQSPQQDNKGDFALMLGYDSLGGGSYLQ